MACVARAVARHRLRLKQRWKEPHWGVDADGAVERTLGRWLRRRGRTPTMVMEAGRPGRDGTNIRTTKLLDFLALERSTARNDAVADGQGVAEER
ncbi:hypothetical protein HPP92_028869 [Vanilla planifolia]|uniref:Uncharacterized protein n=1 Tax=Vanilla planifolia TaxID=51239 RepID=A0A835P6F3_VANPL|nr:hypothetical protein HPP92_028869 [Vanilla planifolia]KAG0446386.1 hypothetical protein HPP92_028858 [Vanilla planifolia]